MIETRDLWVRFGPVAAVRGLSLRAEAGGWTALIGPNGAGKTSALRALAGLAAYEGEVLIDGRDARRLGRREVARLVAFVGIIVPHTIRLLFSMSYRAVVPLSLLVGAGFLVLADVVARTVLSPAELPIGVVTAFLGAPFFAVVLRTSRGAR